MTTSIYELAVNNNGTQHTAYKDGDLPVSQLAVPQDLAVQAKTTDSITLAYSYGDDAHTGFEWQQWIAGISTAWTDGGSLGEDDRGWTATGLPKGSHIGHRIRAVDGASVSAWSEEVWTNTIGDVVPPPTGTDYKTYADATRFVTVSGGGSHNGTSVSNAWTLDEAMLSAQAGDIIGVSPGTYVGTRQAVNDTEKRYTPAYYPRNDGTASNPIYFVAQYPASASSGSYCDIRSGATEDAHDTINGPNATGGWPAFGTNACNYIVWDGFYSNGGDYNNMQTYDAAPCSLWWTTGANVRRCKIIGGLSAWQNGKRNYSAIRMEENRDVVISDNLFEDFGPTAGNCASVIFYSAKNFVIEYNTINNCTNGFQYKGGGQSSDLYGNTVNNRIDGVEDVFHMHSLVAGPDGQRSLFKQNLATNFIHTIYVTSGGTPPLTWDAVDIINNTFVNGADGGNGSTFINYVISGKSNRIKNNIYSGLVSYAGCYGSSGSVASLAGQADFNYNCIHNYTGDFIKIPTPTTLAVWQGTNGEDVNSITSDPKFVGGGNYRLQAGSPCYSAGENGEAQGCYQTGQELIGVRT